MVSFFLYLLLIFVLSILLYIIIVDMIGYFSLNFYKKQGIYAEYSPFFGYVSLFGASSKEDHLHKFKLKYDSLYEKDLFVMNRHNSTSSFVMPVSPKLLRAFFLKEVEFSKKKPLLDNVDMGFIDHSGPRAIHRRTLFKKFFHQDNISSLAPKIHQIFDQYFNAYTAHIWPAGSAKTPK